MACVSREKEHPKFLWFLFYVIVGVKEIAESYLFSRVLVKMRFQIELQLLATAIYFDRTGQVSAFWKFLLLATFTATVIF